MSNNGNGPEDGRDDSNRLVKAKTYRHGWNSDLQALSKFVKEQVFYVVVHDFKNESDDPLDVNHGAICQNLFLKKFPNKVTNVHMKKATKDEMTVYLKDLWTTALNTKGRGNIRRELSSEKSAVYAALNEAFRSKCNSSAWSVFMLLIVVTNTLVRNSFELYREEYSDTSV
jgi:uncharacterized protein YpbB